ncbi:MAG: OmpH family outer membrane protein [Geminicoccaceae bacterium]
MPESRTLLRKSLVLIVLVALGWLQPWPETGAAAQEVPTAVAVVIDYQRILREAAAARSIRAQIEARRQVYQEEVSREEQRLHEEDKEFARQRSVLSPEAFAEKRRQFEQDVADVQRLVQERRRELDRLSAAALNEVKQALIEIVTSMAEERGFNLVLPSSELLFFARTLDLTEEVLAELDARLPEVQLSEVAD